LFLISAKDFDWRVAYQGGVDSPDIPGLREAISSSQASQEAQTDGHHFHEHFGLDNDLLHVHIHWLSEARIGSRLKALTL
jgi:hypothetical protein